MRSQPARSDPYGPGDDSDATVFFVTAAHLAAGAACNFLFANAADGSTAAGIAAIVLLLVFINGAGWASEAIARLYNRIDTRGYDAR